LTTETLVVDPAAPEPEAIARAAACLRAGGLVAFPTETVYGLGAHALDAAAVRRIFEAKERPAEDPLIVHVARVEQVEGLVARVPAAARDLAARFWPGPLTMVMPRAPVVPDLVTAGLNTVAVRVPAHAVARALLAAADIPVAAPSANRFSRPSPTRASHVRDDLGGRIDMIVDGGQTHVGVESTVLDLTGDVATVLRPGAVTLESLRAVIGAVRSRDATVRQDHEPMTSPGLLAKHYSPRAPLTLYEGDPADALARLEADARALISAGKKVGVADFGSDADVGAVAKRLYATLRDLDGDDVDTILARGVAGDAGLAAAIQDRLRRAAGRIVRA
jgi:L-threonylcarbamoyladenylate synthase